jgi:hypothetical protein
MSSNVSYQLFNKQLGEYEGTTTGYYCTENQNMYDTYASTCVNYFESKVQVENAFQSQLNLSELYKGVTPFNVIKTNFMDRDILNSNNSNNSNNSSK